MLISHSRVWTVFGYYGFCKITETVEKPVQINSKSAMSDGKSVQTRAEIFTPFVTIITDINEVVDTLIIR